MFPRGHEPRFDPMTVGLRRGAVAAEQCLPESLAQVHVGSPAVTGCSFGVRFCVKLRASFALCLSHCFTFWPASQALWRKRADVRRGTTRIESMGRGSARQRDLYSSSPRRKS